MYFAKNEIIELANHQKYLVSDSKEINNIYYYQISDITNLKNDTSYVTAKMKDGKIYIDYNIDSEILNELKA